MGKHARQYLFTQAPSGPRPLHAGNETGTPKGIFQLISIDTLATGESPGRITVLKIKGLKKMSHISPKVIDAYLTTDPRGERVFG